MVMGVARSPERVEELWRHGITALRADLDTGEGLEDIPLAGAQVLHSVPPPNIGRVDPRTRHFVDLCRRSPPSRIVYISTTGVYGDHQGDFVDEHTPAAPATERAHRRFDAERALLEFLDETGVPVIILRAPGIYGPGRLPLARIQAGEPVIDASESGPGNRIHRDDLARLCVAALEHGVAGRVYNAGDGDHRSMTEFTLAVARAAGLPAPPSIPLAEAERRLSPAMMSFIRESRVVRADRALAELRLELLYPRMEDGIRASLEEEARSHRALPAGLKGQADSRFRPPSASRPGS